MQYSCFFLAIYTYSLAISALAPSPPSFPRRQESRKLSSWFVRLAGSLACSQKRIFSSFFTFLVSGGVGGSSPIVPYT